ncbi:hypothetical protein [Nocardia cyriacigeorgica]|uniref:hypothetical protein n=1 Tax=Nocardia cyriacigeorgica TaxID=135487 RepID=UPI0034DAE00C
MLDADRADHHGDDQDGGDDAQRECPASVQSCDFGVRAAAVALLCDRPLGVDEVSGLLVGELIDGAANPFGSFLRGFDAGEALAALMVAGPLGEGPIGGELALRERVQQGWVVLMGEPVTGLLDTFVQ